MPILCRTCELKTIDMRDTDLSSAQWLYTNVRTTTESLAPRSDHFPLLVECVGRELLVGESGPNSQA